jgi:hypothetical protein
VHLDLNVTASTTAASAVCRGIDIFNRVILCLLITVGV